MSSPVSSPHLDLPAADGVLEALLAVSLTGVILFRPVYAAERPGQIIDLAYVHLNPAARQMMRQPEKPAESFLTLYPHAQGAGIFAFYRDTFLSGEMGRYDVNYQYDTLDGYFHLVAQRSGELLVVSFTDTASHDRSAVEQALRESQTREQMARAEAELQRQQLRLVLEQAPAMICVFDGPRHVFQFVNAPYQALVGDRPLVGKPIAEAMPELVGQPIFELLDQVYRTGETFYATEMLVQLDHENEGLAELEKRYYNFTYQARRTVDGAVDGIFVFAYEVTTQVLARQQVQRLNDELEERVAQRTQETQAALREAQDQRERLRVQQGLLSRILGQVPAAIATLSGPEHRFSFFNDQYHALAANRTQLGRTVAEVFPEGEAQGIVGLLDEVYLTGKPFVGVETAMLLPDARTGQLEQRYVDFIYQPLFDGQDRIQGILSFILDTTEKVQARQHAELLQAEVLAAGRRRRQEQENVYQLFEQTPAAICLLREPNHRLEYYNPAYQALFPERLLRGLTIAETQPEAVAQGFVALLDHVYQTGEPYYGAEVPLTLEQPGGQPPITRYLNFTYQAYWEDERIEGISVFAFDVTAQVLARREADLQRQLLRALFMEAPAPICILDGPELVYQLVNPAYQQIFPGRELLGKPVLEALPELRDSPVPALLDHVYRTGEVYVARELPLTIARHHDSPLEEGYFTFTYQPRQTTSGEIDGIQVFAFEVTDQVQARRATEANARQLRLLTDALPVLISYVDQEQRYQFANQAYQAWFGQEPSALLGRPVREVIGEQAYQKVRDYIERALAGERLAFDAQMPYREDFARYIHTDYIPDVRDGRVQGFYALVTDVTEQEQGRQQVQHLNEELQAANVELGDTNQQLARINVDLDSFIYTASHDLRAPITNIEGLLHVLQDELLGATPSSPEGVAPVLAMMHESVIRFKRTLAYLSDVVKLQKEQDQPAADVALAEVVDDVLLDLQPLLQQTGACVEVDVAGCPSISFSPKNLRSVVYNLLSNAVKYRHPGRAPHVRISCGQEADYTVLTVQDNGLGLTPAQQGELFTMFRRLHAHVEGSGIGLYMVKRSVENAGGRIEVRSAPDVGTTFLVYFRGR